MDVAVTLEIARVVMLLPESGTVRDQLTGQHYRLSEEEIAEVDPRRPQMTLVREVVVTASVWWEHEGGWGRSGSWVCDDVTATFEGETIELSPSEQSEAESMLVLAAEAEEARNAEDMAAL